MARSLSTPTPSPAPGNDHAWRGARRRHVTLALRHWPTEAGAGGCCATRQVTVSRSAEQPGQPRRDRGSRHGQAGRARSSSSPGKCHFRYHELGPQQALSLQLRGALCFLDHPLDGTPRESPRLKSVSGMQRKPCGVRQTEAGASSGYRVPCCHAPWTELCLSRDDLPGWALPQRAGERRTSCVSDPPTMQGRKA